MKDFQKIQNKIQAAVEKRTKEIDALEVAISHDREALEVARNDMQRGTDTDDLSLYQDARGRVSFYEATIARKDKELEALKNDPLPEAEELERYSKEFTENVFSSIDEHKKKAAVLLRQIKALDDEILSEKKEANEISRMVQVDCMRIPEAQHRLAITYYGSLLNDIKDASSLEVAADLIDGTRQRSLSYFMG